MRLVQNVNNKAVFAGEVSPLPGCPDVAVSHALYRMRGPNGHGREAQRQRLEQLIEMGYSAALCTVADENVSQLAIMQKEGWLEAGWFKNKRTGHRVCLFFMPL